MDSAVAFRLAIDRYPPVLALFFDYGQLAAAPERRAAGQLASRFGVRLETVELPWLTALSHSPLVDAAAPWPDLTAETLGDPAATERSAAAAWIPNRNGLFVQIGAAYAESLGAGRIVVGFNAEEAATFPDNSVGFLEAANAALEYSTRGALRLVAPTGAMTKEQIVRTATELGAPLELIWSCYRSGPEPCWLCESCLRLKRALEAAGEWDRFPGNGLERPDAELH